MTEDEGSVRLRGRVLYLTEDPELVRRQLAGEDLDWDPNDPAHALRHDVSTDEITPADACLHYDEELGRHVYTGLTGGTRDARARPVGIDAVRAGGFVASVAGRRRGKGSSREASPFAELSAGIRVVVGESLERIYRQNAVNLGLLATTDFSVLEPLRRGEPVPLAPFLEGADPVTRRVVARGGLFPYMRARLAGAESPAPPTTGARPMTLAEKLLARRMVTDLAGDRVGVAAVAPGDAGFVRADLRFSHEYVTPMAAFFLERAVGPGARVADPASVLLFRDHLALLDGALTDERRARGDLERAEALARRQEEFAADQGIRLHGSRDGICHSLVLERYALPGSVVVGSDSHTPQAGALGALAFGVGTTDLACAWLTRDVRVTVPPTVKVTFHGRLPRGVHAKDLMLALLAHPAVRTGGTVGKVLEYGGEVVEALSVDERATLTNMAAEAGAFTGLVAPDAATARFLAERRGMPLAEAEALCARARPDPDASYESEVRLDASALSPMVALPGDPGNGVFLDDLLERVPVDIAYGGSCTAGKREDVEMMAAVVGEALERGRGVAPGVAFYVQLGSADVAEWARARGYLDLFERAGARILPPGCGACIGAGPGVSTSPRQVTVSSVNRNFPGRSGPGRVYLASPAVVAASAVAGYLAAWRPGR